MQMRSIAYICGAVLLSSFIVKAAEKSVKEVEQPVSDILSANRVIINNISGYPIEVKTSDSRYALRIANGAYRQIGNLSVDKVVQENLSITEFGHSGKWEGGGEKRGTILLPELISRAKTERRYQPGQAFVVEILSPARYGKTGLYSDWTDRYVAHFDIPSHALGKMELPASADPYDIPDYKAVKDLVSTRYGAQLAGYYPSIDALKQAAPIRWARLVLGLTHEYDKKNIDTAYRALFSKYHSDRYHGATAEQLELLKKITNIAGEAKEILEKSLAAPKK